MMRTYIVLLLILVLGIMVNPQVALAQADETAGQAVIQALNGWRIEQDIWPLRENATLEQMARDQAAYILSLREIPAGGEIHIGARGEDPMARARLPQYNWPTYGSSLYTAISEIAFVGRTAEAARRYWENSTTHRTAALNPAYREIGVAALPHRFGFLYIVVFGSRPNILPATADVQADVLYLSNERYYGARSPFIRAVRKVRLFDSEGRPLTSDWQNWQAEMPLPENAGQAIFVEYMDEDSAVALAVVPLDDENPALPVSTPAPTLPATAVLVQPAQPTATATASGTGTVVPASTGIAPTASLQLAPPTPVGLASNNVMLIYDAKSFTLLNSTPVPINVRDLVFVSGVTSFAVTRWETQWLSGTLTALAGNDCLQVWSWQETATLDTPSRCRQRRSALTIAPNQFFWMQGDFEVRLRDRVLVICRANANQCEFAVP